MAQETNDYICLQYASVRAGHLFCADAGEISILTAWTVSCGVDDYVTLTLCVCVDVLDMLTNGSGSSLFGFHMCRFFILTLVFTQHFLEIVAEVKAFDLPLVSKLWLGVGNRTLSKNIFLSRNLCGYQILSRCKNAKKCG